LRNSKKADNEIKIHQVYRIQIWQPQRSPEMGIANSQKSGIMIQEASDN